MQNLLIMQKEILLIANYVGNNTPYCSYAEDNTPYLNGKKIQNILLDSKQIPDIFLKQFTENYLIKNPEKYHVVVTTKNEISLKLQDLSQKSDGKIYWN